jgi:hypothetical protein
MRDCRNRGFAVACRDMAFSRSSDSGVHCGAYRGVVHVANTYDWGVVVEHDMVATMSGVLLVTPDVSLLLRTLRMHAIRPTADALQA